MSFRVLYYISQELIRIFLFSLYKVVQCETVTQVGYYYVIILYELFLCRDEIFCVARRYYVIILCRANWCRYLSIIPTAVLPHSAECLSRFCV